MKWLKELLEKKPKNFEEYFYSDIHHYFGIEFENEKDDLDYLFKICGDYSREFLLCQNKKDVKRWLDEIAVYIINNIEVDYLIENFMERKRLIPEIKQPE